MRGWKKKLLRQSLSKVAWKTFISYPRILDVIWRENLIENLNLFFLFPFADQNRNHDGNKFIARCFATEFNESRLRHNADAWRWFREISRLYRARCAVRARFSGSGWEDAAEEFGFEAIAGAFNSNSTGKFIIIAKMHEFYEIINVLCNCRSKVFGALASYRKAPALVHSKATEHRAIPVISHHGDISGGWVSSVQRSIANLCAVR